jgi:regulatory protein
VKRSARGDLNFDNDSSEQYEPKSVRLSDIAVKGKAAKPTKGENGVKVSQIATPCAVGEVRVYAIEACGEEGCVRVCCEREDGDKTVTVITVGQLAALGISKGIIGKEEYDALMIEGEIFRAIRQGMTFLSYGDKSQKMLAFKLKNKGYNNEIVARAVDYFVENGFLCEDDGACRLAALCVKKYWGKIRIKSELISKGYSSDAVSAALESVDETDFSELCCQLIRKKYRAVENTAEGRKKLSAALARYGYTYSEIQYALGKFFRS